MADQPQNVQPDFRSMARTFHEIENEISRFSNVHELDDAERMNETMGQFATAIADLKKNMREIIQEISQLAQEMRELGEEMTRLALFMQNVSARIDQMEMRLRAE